MTAHDLAFVDPMMVRRFTPRTDRTIHDYMGGILVLDAFEVEDVGLVSERLPYDEDVVDCSNRIFQLTTMLMGLGKPVALCCFPSRRWRSFREGEHITVDPSPTRPLLYLGNPVRVFCDLKDGISVVSSPEFRIKSGMELGY